LLAFAIALGAAALLIVPGVLQRRMNPVLAPPPYAVRPEAKALHESLRVADLHADALLWSSDLTKRNGRGHVDIPRLIEGNVALQAFTVVTKTPARMNIENNRADSDNITLLAIVQRWPLRTWSILLERARYQAGKLRHFARRSDGRLTVITNRSQLRAYLQRRQTEPDITAGFLGLEGTHALEGELDNVDVLFGAGFRMLGLTHFFDTEVGGSAHGVHKGGLTPFGLRVVQRAERLGMAIDLAHASAALIADVLDVATRPVIVSHTGLRGTCDNQRNLSDEQLRRIAGNGGVVGIGFWPTAVCGNDAAAIARAIVYGIQQIGAEHIALGSDFDGAVGAPFDASGLALITQTLMDAGLPPEQIRLVMGENVIRLLGELLP